MAKILVTGGAGFIASHIVDALVDRGDDVVVFDNLSNGRMSNLAHLEGRIKFLQFDLTILDQVKTALEGVDKVCHQGALGSVPRSIADPINSHNSNANGTLNLLTAAKDLGIKRVVVASSSSIYGDTPELPKHEGMPFNPKSPYAFTKVCTEEYARIFSLVYGMENIALRYFNVFGPRQNPNLAYSAVIPLFIKKIVAGESPMINGDGSTSRDFTYVANVVHGNLLALDAPASATGRAYNLALGGQISLIDLIEMINEILGTSVKPTFQPNRPGDVAHSKASIDDIRNALGFAPIVEFKEGLRRTIEYYKDFELNQSI
jgi:nucleoside-diphosphate-sugar epimerase